MMRSIGPEDLSLYFPASWKNVGFTNDESEFFANYARLKYLRWDLVPITVDNIQFLIEKDSLKYMNKYPGQLDNRTFYEIFSFSFREYSKLVIRLTNKDLTDENIDRLYMYFRRWNLRGYISANYSTPDNPDDIDALQKNWPLQWRKLHELFIIRMRKDPEFRSQFDKSINDLEDIIKVIKLLPKDHIMITFIRNKYGNVLLYKLNLVDQSDILKMTKELARMKIPIEGWEIITSRLSSDELLFINKLYIRLVSISKVINQEIVAIKNDPHLVSYINNSVKYIKDIMRSITDPGIVDLLNLPALEDEQYDALVDLVQDYMKSRNLVEVARMSNKMIDIQNQISWEFIMQRLSLGEERFYNLIYLSIYSALGESASQLNEIKMQLKTQRKNKMDNLKRINLPTSIISLKNVVTSLEKEIVEINNDLYEIAQHL